MIFALERWLLCIVSSCFDTSRLSSIYKSLETCSPLHKTAGPFFNWI